MVVYFGDFDRCWYMAYGIWKQHTKIQNDEDEWLLAFALYGRRCVEVNGIRWRFYFSGLAVCRFAHTNKTSRSACEIDIKQTPIWTTMWINYELWMVATAFFFFSVHHVFTCSALFVFPKWRPSESHEQNHPSDLSPLAVVFLASALKWSWLFRICSWCNLLMAMMCIWSMLLVKRTIAFRIFHRLSHKRSKRYENGFVYLSIWFFFSLGQSISKTRYSHDSFKYTLIIFRL